MCKIIIINNGVKTEYETFERQNLLGFLRTCGYHVPAVCGGNGTCGKCRVKVNGEYRLACDTPMIDGMVVELADDMTAEILTDYISTKTASNKDGLGIAVDLGTSTVVLVLIDLKSGKSLSTSAFENPQRSFGFDVLSRIAAAESGSLSMLQRLICDKIFAEIKAISGGKEIEEIVVSGNTTMIHLLLGQPCGSLGVYPFSVEYKLFNPYDSSLFGCPMKIIPWISAFVGGDIVSGLIETDHNETFILADIGTNGELVLHHNGKYFCTSAAAGPAFEGGNIKNGMAGVSGAVCAVDCDFNVTVIGGVPAVGICGSGVLDTVSVLIEKQMIDENGTLSDEYFEDGVKLCENIAFTSRDIREVQLAKSAIRSGIEILIKEAGITCTEIDKVYLAGGFGTKMNVENAVKIGLFPRELKSKIVTVGNSSLSGAVQMLLADKTEKADEIIQNSKEINLSAHADFNDYFMEYMGFEND